ncbi:hypothetical protein LSG31_21485 [Fodinisporobacter ferrooxydans]|uniref:Bh protein n=1 Tax=Fodinisporobacter ferrooxydans TaxID=2901836 RepID=A0ABY4CIX0_9BACL|nr:hypothetical protein LSG31_21485 [Alicyclobacillaceae bacterium MYW30-H2]
MYKREVETELFCVQCAKDSLHTVVYINGIIYKITCETCGKIVVNGTLSKEVYGRLVERALTKPKRMKQEIEQEIKLGELRKMMRLPLRMVSKPFRLYHEVEGIKKLEKEKPMT